MIRRSIPAIPTEYNGTRYRSRLEARWAAMFDLLGWAPDYEPGDGAGGWIPDFQLSGSLTLGVHDYVAVEVKPAASPTHMLLLEACVKVDRSGWQGPALVLGSSPFFDGVAQAQPVRFGDDGGILPPLPVMPETRTIRLGRLRPAARAPWTMAHLARPWGHGFQVTAEVTPLTVWAEAHARALWSTAGNMTQWKAPA